MNKLCIGPGVSRHPVALMAVAILLLTISSASAQQVFQTPEDAATALANAVKSGAARDILKVLGPDAVDIMLSGDEVADREANGSWEPTTPNTM